MLDLSLILRPVLRFAGAVALMLTANSSMAFQLHIPQYTGVPLMISAGVVNRLTLESSLRPASGREEAMADRSAPLPASRQDTIVTGRPGAYAKKLAQTYPGEHQAEAERLFRELLAGYQAIEDQFKIPRNDLAGSLAAFVAGSYMAYHGIDFPDAHFKPLVAQMRQIVSGNETWASASAQVRHEMFEQMATLGMFMASSQMALTQRPNAAMQARLREAARSYLEGFLKVDAHRVQITANGLALR